MRTETRVGIFIIVAVGIFIYLSINIGELRLDTAQYNVYKTYFDDAAGLDAKAVVKIAGVDVGWVSDITLLEDGKAEVIMRVSKTVKLAKNAYAVISQEGLIGTKTMDIEPGDPSTGILLPGSILSVPGKSPTTVSDLLDQFKDIASSVQDLADSLKNVFATREGETNMKQALNSIATASDRMADFSILLHKTMEKNEENINETIVDFKETAHHLGIAVPSIKKDFNKLTLSFADKTLPKFADASKSASSAFSTIDDTAVQARETFREAEQVVEKINTGKGTIGRLINEDETYEDLKKTIRGLKDYISKAQSLVIDVDMHSETLLARDWNSKGYMEIRIRPYQDYFYKIQLVGDERGTVHREEEHRKWFDEDGHKLDIDQLVYGDDAADIVSAQKAHDRLEFASKIERKVNKKDQILFGFQFGKRFDRLALRIGMFENSFGVGVDYYVPMQTNKIHWVTSLEAFDFKGKNKMVAGRPHIKWLNKIFFMKHIYTAFGFSDMVGKHTSGPFWGTGIRFGDDDLKYLFSMLPVGKMSGGK
ncbi:MCE family protein [Candidatus Babeliales bacterium]|nr:MCE family protein [Candidatus Babeliales bacterium]